MHVVVCELPCGTDFSLRKKIAFYEAGRGGGDYHLPNVNNFMRLFLACTKFLSKNSWFWVLFFFSQERIYFVWLVLAQSTHGVLVFLLATLLLFACLLCPSCSPCLCAHSPWSGCSVQWSSARFHSDSRNRWRQTSTRQNAQLYVSSRSWILLQRLTHFLKKASSW